ncbi:MAG: gephyrin-like molybdotransferase Glp [Mariniblastus sp.]
MISIEKAFELIAENVNAMQPVSTPIADAVGKVLAANVEADVDSPPHDKSVMDGFAVRSSDIAAGSKRLEVIETVIAGGWPTEDLQPQQATRIMTGAPIPLGADAVVMVEQTEVETVDGKEFVNLAVDSIAPEKHVLRRGVNFSKGQIVFEKGHVVRPTDIGLLAEVGSATILTGATPTVSVLPTGDELVSCEQLPGRGQIRNSNGPMLLAMVQSLGLRAKDEGIGRDNEDDLRSRIEQGLKSDMLILSGGVSAGTKDLVPGILESLGVQQVFHKVLVKPGKPIWFGILDRTESGTGPVKRTYVFGLPGNPVSSLVGFHLFVRAAIRKLTGQAIDKNNSCMGRLSEAHQTRGDRPTYWPGKRVMNDSVARKFKPLVWRGSSDLFALGESEGLIFFPANSGLCPEGAEVRFHPFG